MKKLCLIIIALCIPALMGFSWGQRESKSKVTLNVYNWGDYIDEDVLDSFEEETGIKVNYETFATNEDMYVKVKQGGTKFDVIIPSDYMIARMIKEDLLEKIDATRLPTFKNIDPRFLKLEFDPKNEYSVPYMWGTLGILYNKKMVDKKVDSWNILWDKKYAKQILMMDSVRDTLAVAFMCLGYSLNTTDKGKLQEAAELLIKQKPLVRAYVGDNGKDMMINGEAALSVNYSGDAVFAMEKNPDLAYAIPKEKTNLWVDSMVVPKNSAHKKEALLFIDFMNSSEIAKMNAEFIGYSTPNKETFALLDAETRNNPAAYPGDKDLPPWEVFVDIGEANAEYSRVWTEIKSK